MFFLSLDLHILKHNYAFLLRSLPETHLSTLECLQDYLTDDCICAVVESTNVSLANKMMLDCIISKLTCKEDLLDFFDQLEKINNAHNLASTVNELRQGKISNNCKTLCIICSVHMLVVK